MGIKSHISLIAAYVFIAVGVGLAIAQGYLANQAILANRHVGLTNQALIKKNAVLARQNHALLLRLCAANHC